MDVAEGGDARVKLRCWCCNPQALTRVQLEVHESNKESRSRAVLCPMDPCCGGAYGKYELLVFGRLPVTVQGISVGPLVLADQGLVLLFRTQVRKMGCVRMS